MAERARHKLRIKEEFANAIITGEKNFEIRKNDRGFQRGDFIEFVVFFIHNIYLVSLSFDTFFMFVHKYSEK